MLTGIYEFREREMFRRHLKRDSFKVVVTARRLRRVAERNLGFELMRLRGRNAFARSQNFLRRCLPVQHFGNRHFADSFDAVPRGRMLNSGNAFAAMN